MTRYVNIFNVHGIGAPTRGMDPGEEDVWVTHRQFEMLLDAVLDRPDVRLTFDDGNLSDIEIALPMLLERELRAEFFVCPGLFDHPGRLGVDGVRELLKAGMGVGSHGWSHIDWRTCDQATVLEEIQTSRNALRQITGAEIAHVSVPFGSYDRHVLRELRHFGVSRVYTSDATRTRPESWLQARTSLRSNLDAPWIAAVLDPEPSFRQQARGLAATVAKRSRGQWRSGRSAASAAVASATPTIETPAAETPAAVPTPAIETSAAQVAEVPVRPRIAIVIVTYNSGDVLGPCLESLKAGAEGVELVEVVVVDNASSDDSVDVATEPYEVPVRSVEFGINAGYAAGLNAGVTALATEQLDGILLLNPDCRMLPGSLAELAKPLGTAGRGIVVPKLINPDGSMQPSLRHAPAIHRSLAESLLGSRAARMGIGELVIAPQSYEHAGTWAWATGAAMLMSTTMLDEVGPWDESFLLYSEETEFALRAGDYGWQVYYEPASVIEHVGGTGHLKPQLAALLAANRVRSYRLRHGLVRSCGFYLVELLGSALRAGLARPQARAAVGVLLRPSRRIRRLSGPA